MTAEQAARWASGTAEDWANESHAVANRIAYADVPTLRRAPTLPVTEPASPTGG